MRWNEWTKIPFPDGASQLDINGVDLIEIDTFSSGCISAYVDNRGKLDRDRIEILRNCTGDLDSILGELTGEIGDYFSELSNISHQVLSL